MINNFAKKLLRECSHANSVAISGHKNPDYDCLCASLAMQEILSQNKIKADILVDKPLDLSVGKVVRENNFLTTAKKDYDVIICVDTAELKLVPNEIVAKKDKAITFNIDHHKDNSMYLKYNYVKGGESSACEVVFNLFEKYFKLNQKLATFFYIGIYSDTGGFIYSNVKSSTFAVLTKLAITGIKMDEIVQENFCSISKEGFEITKRAYNSVKFFENGQIAVSTLRSNDFVETKASYSEGKNIVSVIQSINGVKVAISISEHEKGVFHVSLRTTCDGVDVSLIAKKFNGGGHTRASGLKMVGEYEKILSAILNQTKNVLGLLK